MGHCYLNFYKQKKKNKKQNKPININVSKEKVNKYIAIEYGENLYHTLKNQLKKHTITLASKASNKLEKKLTYTNKNIPSDIFDGTGVYRLNCSDCTQFYICLLFTSRCV